MELLLPASGGKLGGVRGAMFIAVMMALAIAVGYGVTVLISLLLTFAVTMALPRFAEADHLIRNGYKLLHESIWLVAAALGGYVTAAVARGIHPMVTELALMAALIWVLWDNSWEARQRGMAHQVLITVCTVVGVAGGYVLQARLT